jgi:hypothetical protein
MEALAEKYDSHIKNYLMEITTHEKIVNELINKHDSDLEKNQR